MLYSFLNTKIPDNIIILIASAICFGLTYMCMAKHFSFLPRDGGKFVIDAEGKKVAVNESSSGKYTGVGLVFVIIYLTMVLLFVPFSVELLLYVILSLIMMITGYLDDASKNPWRELVKGILDLILAVLTALVFIKFNPTDVSFFGFDIHIHPIIYIVLAIMLIWGSINVTNCSDGVDGLAGTVSAIELIAIALIFRSTLGDFGGVAIILAFTLVAYLAFNWNPSTVLMGDAGSRTIGFLLALLCMKSQHPYSFLLLSFVFLFDGGLGLLKLVVMRVTKKSFLGKIRFPFHDELRKNRGWNIPKIVVFFSICEIVFAAVTAVIIKVFA